MVMPSTGFLGRIDLGDYEGGFANARGVPINQRQPSALVATRVTRL